MMNGKAILVWLGVLPLVLAAILPAAAQKSGSGSVAIKPDLRVVSVQVERSGFSADGSHLLRVRITVVNSAVGAACAGPFTVMASKNDLRSEWYTFLGRGDVARLCADPARAAAATATLEFADTVPVGEQRRYMAQVDEGNRVDEAKEDNNIGRSATYVAKSFCSGVDLLLTSVEAFRAGRDVVYFRARGLNRCSGSCSANVKFTFAVVEPATGYGDTSQTVAIGITGLAEFENPPVGIYGRTDRSVTYRVRIDPEGGACSDGTPGNNECLLTLAASEASKTQSCH
jgi:hypothetical protein